MDSWGQLGFDAGNQRHAFSVGQPRRPFAQALHGALISCVYVAIDGIGQQLRQKFLRAVVGAMRAVVLGQVGGQRVRLFVVESQGDVHKMKRVKRLRHHSCRSPSTREW